VGVLPLSLRPVLLLVAVAFVVPLLPIGSPPGEAAACANAAMRLNRTRWQEWAG